MLLSLSGCFQSLHPPKPSFLLLHFLLPLHHYHTNQPTQNLSNFYSNLLHSNPRPHSIHQIHAKTIVDGSSKSSFLSTHLLKSYAKLEDIQSARLVFETVQSKRIFIWNAMIRALSRTQSWQDIVRLYKRMEEEEEGGRRAEPDHYTLPFVIKAFGELGYVEQGSKVHELAISSGLVRNVYVATGLIEMYIKFGQLDIAFKLFNEMPERDVVAWTSLISGYVEHGCYNEALTVFRNMRLGDDKPNWVTVLSLIPACDHLIHSYVMKSGFDSAGEVQIAILNMYVKIGDVVKAYTLFDEMFEKNLVSWTIMVSGYSQNGYASEALMMFHRMLNTTDLRLDAIIAASVVQACAQLGALNYGEMIHGYIIQLGLVTQLEVQTSFVDMYAKCGCLNTAQRIFDGIRNRNIITWSALISGYGCHGFGAKALDLFEKMKSEGFVPDETAFLGVLSACSHSGLVCEGKGFFNLMQKRYRVTPGMKHYACMVDLLGRAGLVDEAWDLIKGMPFEPDTNIWGTLLSACKIRGSVKIAEHAYRRLSKLDYDDTDYQVLLANTYASCGKWNEASKVRSSIRKKGDKKIPGYSYIEVNCRIHNFFAGDESHPESKNLNFILEMLHTLASNNLQISC